MKTSNLISELGQYADTYLADLEWWMTLDEQKLRYKTDPSSWSVLECVEHLNRYARFYIPELRTAISLASSGKVDSFSPGWLGNYFAEMMLPKTKSSKMKTLKAMNPLGENLGKEVIKEAIALQQEMVELLRQAENRNLGSVRTPISISKWIRLKLGDTFRVVVYHAERHRLQARANLDG